MTEKTKKAMDHVWRTAILFVGTFCGFLFSQSIDHEKRLTAIEAKLGPLIREAIHSEIERCVPPAWFKAQVDKIAADLEVLKKDMSEARQEIRDLRKP